MTAEIREACAGLPNVQYIEFKTYVSEDAENVRAHLFESLYTRAEIGRARRIVKGVESQWTPALKEIGERFLELKTGVRLSRAKASYLKVLTGIGGIHYEWHIFGKQKAMILEVALHLETTDRKINRLWIDKLLPYKADLEKLLGEKANFGSWSKLGTQREHRWRKISVGRKFDREIPERIKKWATHTMVKMYEFFAPKLKTHAREIVSEY
jgi:hypothetical protein